MTETLSEPQYLNQKRLLSLETEWSKPYFYSKVQLGTDPKAKRDHSLPDSIIKAQFKGATELWTDQTRNNILNSLFEHWSQIDPVGGRSP